MSKPPQLAPNTLKVGEPAPWFTARCTSNERYAFDSVGGRYVVLGFFGSASSAFGSAYNAFIHTIKPLLDDTNICFFGVSTNNDDEKQQLVKEYMPGIRYFWDADLKISQLYNTLQADGSTANTTYVLDPMLRVIGVFKHENSQTDFAKLAQFLQKLPKIPAPFLATPQAPALVIPYVFEPTLCKALIDYYEKNGGDDSGFMRESGGKTVGMIDYKHKRRRDCDITDLALKEACMHRINNRLVPAIEKAFQFKVTRMERHIVACYDANEQAHFRAHRDNTTPSTLHRKFAVSLFLNTGEFEGGFLKFPEYGSAHYIAPAGGAVVFSCSMLHEATTVTAGKRYMFLPFLYDDAAALVRQETASLIVGVNETLVE